MPLSDQMEQLTRLAKDLATLRATQLARRDIPHEAMAGRTRIMLLDQLTTGSQGGQLEA